jgi:protease I
VATPSAKPPSHCWREQFIPASKPTPSSTGEPNVQINQGQKDRHPRHRWLRAGRTHRPQKESREGRAKVDVLSIKTGQIKGWDRTNWGKSVKVDHLVSEVRPTDYDALVLPGGQINPDKLRTDKNAVAFIKQFVETGKPVAAICHGPWGLIEADVVKGKTVTSWPSVHTDLKNAGARWVDKEVVQDGNLITSRRPEDIPAFSNQLIESLAKAS